MTRTSRLTGLVLAGVFLALHLPFLPASLEDLDSINFAMGIQHFDVSRHQPHPPGYPVFIAGAKILHAIGLSELRALSLLGVGCGSLAVLALLVLFTRLDDDRRDSAFTWMAVLMVAASPLYWLTASRPLSDMAGLAAALAADALILRASSARRLAVAAAWAAFAVGIRSQVAWLTLPLLLLAVARLAPAARLRGLVFAASGYAAGALVWAVPLVVVSGGPAAYWRAVSSQGAEDLSGVAMLWTTPTVRQLAQALQYTFLAPWGPWQLGAAMLVLAAAGVFQMGRHARPALVALVVAFGPYLVFDLLFQESITTRYALPLVAPVVYLAVQGLSLVPDLPAFGLAIALVAVSAWVDDDVLLGYARFEAPAFRMLGDMSEAASAAGASFEPPVLAMHRREEFDLRRPVQWVGSAFPATARRLPATAKHEWLELVNYWNAGGRAPVWFVADPLRSDLELVHQERRPTRYRWPFAPTLLLGGARPNEVDWHVIDAPDWYLGEGWSLTPETAGIAREDRRGPGFGPVSGWIRRWQEPVAVMIGGRNLAAAGAPAQVRMTLDGAMVDEFSVPPGFFLRTITIPSLAGPGAYATLAVGSDSQQLAIEQFDAQPGGRVMFGFGEGWNEQEYNPATGLLWRWTSDRSVLRVRAEGHAVALTLQGVIEAASASHVVIRAGERVVAEFEAGRAFERTVIIPADAVSQTESAITIESSASYVPAETRWRSEDRRRLGLKLTECRVTRAS